MCFCTVFRAEGLSLFQVLQYTVAIASANEAHNLSVLVKKYSLLHGTFGRAAPLFVVCRVREGQGERPEGSRPFPSLETSPSRD